MLCGLVATAVSLSCLRYTWMVAAEVGWNTTAFST